jgi:hypothetical protein
MFCPRCGNKMIWNNDFSEDYEDYYQIDRYYSCSVCNTLVNETTFYESDNEETFFTIMDEETEE